MRLSQPGVTLLPAWRWEVNTNVLGSGPASGTRQPWDLGRGFPEAAAGPSEGFLCAAVAEILALPLRQPRWPVSMAAEGPRGRTLRLSQLCHPLTQHQAGSLWSLCTEQGWRLGSPLTLQDSAQPSCRGLTQNLSQPKNQSHGATHHAGTPQARSPSLHAAFQGPPTQSLSPHQHWVLYASAPGSPK